MENKPKHAGGRPTEYKAEYIQKADEYLELNQDEDIQQLKQSGKISDAWDYKKKVRLPTIEGFAMFIGVSKKSLYEWEKKDREFSHALDKIRTEQHNRLLNNGLSGDYNSTIAKLILSSNHGYKEKTDVTTNDKDLPAPILGNLNLGGFKDVPDHDGN